MLEVATVRSRRAGAEPAQGRAPEASTDVHRALCYGGRVLVSAATVTGGWTSGRGIFWEDPIVKRLIAAVALAVVFMAAPAAAQQYPPPVNSLTVSDPTPTPGQTIGIVGRTFAPGATVTVTMTSGPVGLGTAAADAAGIASLQSTIPADTPVGPHTIAAVGQAPDGSELSLSVSINVVSTDDATITPAANGPGGSLPRTGDDASLPLARVGLGLAALGGVVLAVASKRRKSTPVAA